MTTVLDVVGIFCLAAFAWFVWPPACLIVFGAALLLISWQRSGDK
ncbi:MAG: hypothetical protein RL347_1451 [Actinomycetota bacterium]|jgi:hypothetical protein